MFVFFRYRTQFRPTYKIAYKTVTELEWRCCPGYQGPDCREVKGSPNRQTEYPQSYPQQPQHGQTRPAQSTLFEKVWNLENLDWAHFGRDWAGFK